MTGGQIGGADKKARRAAGKSSRQAKQMKAVNQKADKETTYFWNTKAVRISPCCAHPMVAVLPLAGNRAVLPLVAARTNCPFAALHRLHYPPTPLMSPSPTRVIQRHV